jgi:benzoyl-CoA reductase subunit C
MQVLDPVMEARNLSETPVVRVVEDWKSAHPGSKAVGWFPVFSPLELTHAAGMLPIAIAGGGNLMEIAHADSRFQSFICSIIKSTLELGLTGQLQKLDGMIFHSICDPAKNLASVFRRNFPDVMVEFVHFPQNLKSPLAEEYLLAEYARIRRRLADLAGREITDEEIRSSIAVYNGVRARIRQLEQIRLDVRSPLSAAEAAALLRAGGRMMPEEFIVLLDEAIDAVLQRETKNRDRIPVVLEGSFCEMPPLDLIEAIEEAGCSILHDDLQLGMRWFTGDIPVGGDPLRALAHSYIASSVHSAVKHDLRYRKAAPLIEKVRRTGAQAVVVLTAKFCEPALFDYALYRQALEDNGIPHVLLEFEEKMWAFDKIRSEVETFVESMMFD